MRWTIMEFLKKNPLVFTLFLVAGAAVLITALSM